MIARETVVNKSARAARQGADARALSTAGQCTHRRADTRAAEYDSGGAFARAVMPMVMSPSATVNNGPGSSGPRRICRIRRRDGLLNLRLRNIGRRLWGAYDYWTRNYRIVTRIIRNHRLRSKSCHKQ